MRTRIAFFVALVSLGASLRAQTIDNLTIPKKTEIFITLERSISTRTATSGDKFYGKIAVPVTANDKIVLPVGAYIIGHVDMSKQAPRLKGKAELSLRFDTIILPDGTTRDIQAILGSAEGYESASPNEQGKVSASTGQAEDVGKGAVAGGGVGVFAGGMAGQGWGNIGIGAAVGAATGAVIGALMRNNEVDLPRGSSITIVLDNDIRFVKPTPPPEGKPL